MALCVVYRDQRREIKLSSLQRQKPEKDLGVDFDKAHLNTPPPLSPKERAPIKTPIPTEELHSQKKTAVSLSSRSSDLMKQGREREWAWETFYSPVLLPPRPLSGRDRLSHWQGGAQFLDGPTGRVRFEHPDTGAKPAEELALAGSLKQRREDKLSLSQVRTDASMDWLWVSESFPL